MQSVNALIIDDEPDLLELLSITLLRMGLDCDTAADVAEAKQKIDANQYSVCFTDMKLPDGNGLSIVEYMQQQQPETPIAVITAHGNMQTAIKALKLGAFDFVSKPIDLPSFRNMVTNALKVNQQKNQDSSQKSRASLSRQFIGDTDVMQRLKQLIRKVSKSQAPIYIKGESGTGKEMVARLIHKNGPRADKPFVAINCGAIPVELMESEFFGHKKGSFTGASADKTGLFQAADEGTLFLDEVADLPLNMQVKLLRAVQERAIRPVGSDSEISLNVRILSASHKDLNQLVSDGSFRQDLFYRINVIEVEVPALKQRKKDIPALVDYFLQRLAQRNQTDALSVSEAAMKQLCQYDFPGNIRELENILERAFTLSLSNHIDVDDLNLVGSDVPLADDAQSSPDRQGEPLEDYLEKIERQQILQALEKTSGNKTAAAEMLGISFRAMRYRLKKLGLD